MHSQLVGTIIVRNYNDTDSSFCYRSPSLLKVTYNYCLSKMLPSPLLWRRIWFSATVGAAVQVTARPTSGVRAVVDPASQYLIGPSVFEVPSSLRNFFPAGNFNRNVTTTWWETEVLDSASGKSAEKAAKALKEASFIVLDREMYKVRPTHLWKSRWFGLLTSHSSSESMTTMTPRKPRKFLSFQLAHPLPSVSSTTAQSLHPSVTVSFQPSCIRQRKATRLTPCHGCGVSTSTDPRQ